ncbi:MAG: penicillin-binding protein activator [Candidatus Adiutrix sp.]|jgi:branched-chain amino acid transport system substrate-binding protein|nr:penicillin-binding protein activator [Candidatus Adiutrix sp.]
MPVKRLSLPVLALLLVFCAACLPVSTRTSTTTPQGGARSGPDGILASAEAAYSQGQYGAAVDYYKKYLAAEPDSPRLESVLAAYGLAAEKAGQLNDAASAYELLLNRYPAGEFTAETGPRLAAVYLASGDAARAETLAASLLAKERDAARQSRLRLILAQSQWTRGAYPEAASNFLSAWRSSAGRDKAEAEEGALASLTRLNPGTLEQIQKQYGQNFPGPEAAYLLIRQALQAGDRDRALTQAEYFSRYFSTHRLMPQVRALREAADKPGLALPPPAFAENYDPRQTVGAALAEAAPPASMGRIGTIGDVTLAVIVPLSGEGSSAKYAQEIVSGLKLAVAAFSAAGSIGLNVMDSRGSAEEAVRLVNAAAADPKVLAVVGPVLSRETASAAQAADRAGLPLIAVSQQSNLTAIGPNIFRIFLTPKHQAEAVARYTVLVQGHRQLGILYPDDNYGKPIYGYFENEVRRLGAELTVAESYDPQTGDWSALVSGLTGGPAERKVSSSYQAPTDFTALYLPDSAGPVAQILAQLAFYDVTKMQYLGSPLWLSQDFLVGSSRYVQGAVIPVALSELSRREESRRFITNFQSAYGYVPDQFAAYGYDAGLAVIKALGQGAESREAVRRNLLQGGAVPGATGPFSFDAGGEYSVDPTLLSVKGRELILLREAGAGLR